MQERKIITRNKIFASALSLFNEKGIDGTSTREITQKAGIAEGTLYRHFTSKDELAWCLFEHHYRNIAQTLSEAKNQSRDFRETVEFTVHAFCSLVDYAPAAFQYCMLSQHNFLDRVAADDGNPVIVIRSIIVDAIREGLIPEGDPNLLTSMALGIVMQPATFLLYGRLKGPFENHAKECAEAVWLILSARTGE